MNFSRVALFVRNRKKFVLGIAAGFVALLVVVVLGGAMATRLLADRLEEDVRREWRRTVGGLDEFEARFPPRRQNALGAELDRLMAELDLAKNGYLVPTELESVTEYIFREGRDPTPLVGPPPPAVLACLARRQELLDEIVRLLIGSRSSPEWGFSLTGAPNAVPLIRHRRLGELLLADALSKWHDGCRLEAEERLEAAGRLAVAAEFDPSLVNRMLAVGMRRRLAVVIRKFGQPQFDRDDWLRPERLAEWHRDFRRREGWWYLQPPSRNRRGVGWPPFSAAESALFEGYLRLCGASRSNGWRQEALVEEGLRCGESSDSVVVAKWKELLESERATSSASWWRPQWDRLPPVAYPNLRRFRRRVDLGMIELELTRKILEIRRHRGDSPAWPAEVPGIEKSVCRGAEWIYDRSKEGEVSLLFSRGPLVGEDDAVAAPILEYRAFD